MPSAPQSRRQVSETALAVITLVAAMLHFALETYYHFTWGQPLQALIVDYICTALMLLGGIRSLTIRPESAAGLLAAGWAFALGFGWRSVFGRLEALSTGIAPDNGEPGYVITILIVALSAVAIILCWSLILAWRQSSLPRH